MKNRFQSSTSVCLFLFIILFIGYSSGSPGADFTAFPVSGEVPLTVSFTDISSVPDGSTIIAWNWSFGDGQTASIQNPEHVYTDEGLYDVTLTIDFGNGTDSLLKQSYISVSEPPPELIADFFTDPVSGSAPLTVFFFDLSSGPIEWWDWDFGDGSPRSTEQHPVHDYVDPGLYSVNLTVGYANQSASTTMTDLIIVEAAAPPLEPVAGTSSILTPGTQYTDQHNPDISGDLVVWSGSGDHSQDIYVYNLSSGGELDITPDERCGTPDHQYPDQVDPSIEGHIIVWVDGRNSFWDIYLYDLESQTEILVTPDTAGSNQVDPIVSGDRIVWSDDRDKGNSQYDVYLYSITTGEEMLLSPDMTSISLEHPRLSGDYVVCEGYDLNNWSYDIYLYDITTAVWTLLTPDTPWSDQKNPDISGDYIVWDGIDEMQGTQDVYLYNLSSGTTMLLTEGTASTDQMNPKIEGDTIVWEDNRIDGGWNYDIVLYSVTSGIAGLITPDTATNQASPEISGNRVVWSGYSDLWTWDVYLFTKDIERPPLETDFSANVTASRAPMTVSFTDQTQGEPAFWFWDFGDGNTSEEQNPDHTFIDPGTYGVTLWTGNPYQRAMERKDDYISAGSPPVAKFSATPQSGLSPLTVQFS
ncbi:MAG: PKD domain-containing protein, partial [Methanomicrobiales archaeon]|nr:PKD domain-containing protein [Methanomicrobiales archaeon]